MNREFTQRSLGILILVWCAFAVISQAAVPACCPHLAARKINL